MIENTTRRQLLRAAPAVAGLAGLTALASTARADHHEGGMPKKLADTLAGSHNGSEYTLPPLPYDVAALEPHIDAQTMSLHHDKHHQGYVNGLNKNLAALKDLAGPDPDGDKVAATQRDLSFNGGGHVLHTYFWATMSPDGGGQPSGDLADAVNATFGSFDAFKGYFSKAAGGVKGSGWGILAYEPIGDNLCVLTPNEHDANVIAGTCPLLPIDVWEHAYYLKYQNKRADYIAAWFNVIDWDAVGGLYAAMRKMTGNA
jgi:Fe-Mn family superoxide dismutase